MTQSQIFGCDEKNHNLIKVFSGDNDSYSKGDINIFIFPRAPVLFYKYNITIVAMSKQTVTISITCQFCARNDFPFH